MERSVRRLSVYDGQGECCGQALELELVDPPPTERVPNRTSLRQVMTADIVCARADLAVGAVVRLMIDHHIGCVPVVDDRRRPIGMITKFDVVEHVHAFLASVANGSPMPADLAARTADELMMPLAMTLHEDATVAHAAQLMVTEDLHHVLVVNERGQLVGVVSTKDITNWILDNAGEVV